MEITDELIEKWNNIGMLLGAKNYDNLVFAYEYILNKYNNEYILNFNNSSTYIVAILYRIFRNISIDLPQDFIKNKIDSMIENFENEFKIYIESNNQFREEFDLEATFCLIFSRKNHFNIIL